MSLLLFAVHFSCSQRNCSWWWGLHPFSELSPLGGSSHMVQEGTVILRIQCLGVNLESTLYAGHCQTVSWKGDFPVSQRWSLRLGTALGQRQRAACFTCKPRAVYPVSLLVRLSEVTFLGQGITKILCGQMTVPVTSCGSE